LPCVFLGICGREIC